MNVLNAPVRKWALVPMLMGLFAQALFAQTRIDWNSGRPDFQTATAPGAAWHSQTPIWIEAFHNIERMPDGWVQVERSKEPGQNTQDINPESGRLFNQRGMGFIDAYVAGSTSYQDSDLAMYQVVTRADRYNSIQLRKGLPAAFRSSSVTHIRARMKWQGTLGTPSHVTSPQLVVYVERNGQYPASVLSLNGLFGARAEQDLTTGLIARPGGSTDDEILIIIQVRGFRGVSKIDDLVIEGLNSQGTVVATYNDDFQTRHGMEELEKFSTRTDPTQTHVNVIVYLRDLIPLAGDPRVTTKEAWSLETSALDSFLYRLPSKYRVFLKVILDPDEAFLFPELHTLGIGVDNGVPADTVSMEKVRQRVINYGVLTSGCNYTEQTWRKNGGSDLRHASVASDAYQNYYQSYLNSLVSTLAGRPYAGKMAGFMFGFATENFIIGDFAEHLPDYHPMLTDAAEICDRQGSLHHGEHHYYLPTSQNGLLNELDAANLHTRQMAETLAGQIDQAAQTIRRAWTANNQIIVGTYYAYLGELSGGWGRMMIDGHSGAVSPALDMIMAPSAYKIRGYECETCTANPLDHSGGFMTMVEALHARQIMMIQELDLRTDTTYNDSNGTNCAHCPIDELSTISQFKRDLAIVSARGTGAYYLDFGNEPNSWFDHLDANGNDDGRYWDLMGELYDAFPAVDETDGNQLLPEAEVAFVVDRESLAYGYFNNAGLHTDLVSQLREEVARAGFRFDWLTMDALLEPGAVDPNRYKMMVFLNTVTLNSDETAKIQTLKSGGRTLVFVHAPGYLQKNGDTWLPNLQATRDLIFQPGDPASLVLVELSNQPRPKVTLNGQLGLPVSEREFGQSNAGARNYPLLSLGNSSGVTVLGSYTDRSADEAAWRKSYGSWTSVYLGVPGAHASLWRRLAEHAGVTIYATDNQFVHMGNNRLYAHINPRTSSNQAVVTLPGNLELEAVSGPDLATRQGYTNGQSSFLLNASSTEGASVYKVVNSAPAQLPDLVLVDISWSPANPKVGDTVIVSATIRNDGPVATPTDGSSPVPVGVGFQVDGATLGAFFVTDSLGRLRVLQSGETYTGSCYTTWTPSIAKDYSLFAYADDIDRFLELDDTINNTRTETVTVQSFLPDVIITDIIMTPTNPKVGDTVVLQATVKNIGTAPTPLDGAGNPVPVGVGFNISGSSLGAFFVRSGKNKLTTLGVNESYTGTCHINWQPKTAAWYTVYAHADDIDRFLELDDSLSSNRQSESVYISN